MYNETVFAGKNGLYWFFGTVESDGDPLGLGRCRVRIVGWHNEDFNLLKTTQLPWAYPITSLNDWAIGGKGKSLNPPPPGTRVVGFFLDGQTGQKPVIFGTVPGNTEQEIQRAIEYGSREWLPNPNSISGQIESDREGDIFSVDDQNIARENVIIPDQRLLNVNPTEWVIPYTGFISSAYNEARGHGRHNGVDICPAGFYRQTSAGAPHLNGALKGPTGLPVYSAANGEVILIWKSDRGLGGIFSDYDIKGPPSNRRRSFGNCVIIKHTLSTGTYLTVYGHLGVSQDPANDAPGSGISVSVGDRVTKGQQIGTVGRSHVWDSLTHLHFEIRVGTALPAAGNHINPGRVFPQLFSRHSSMRSWVETQPSYNIQELPASVSDAPVIAGEGPA
jgi:murein DD-endopeptidase MepM/ murein hydrolase activator NlpD